MPGVPSIPGISGILGRVTLTEILRIIEFSHPDIVRIMRAYGIPLPTTRSLIRRIVRVALSYCR